MTHTVSREDFNLYEEFKNILAASHGKGENKTIEIITHIYFEYPPVTRFIVKNHGLVKEDTLDVNKAIEVYNSL